MIPAAVVRELTVPANVLITGASGGIGVAIVRQLIANPRVANVIAVSRKAESSAELIALRDRHGIRLSLIAADITDENDLSALARRVGDTVATLHLVFNAAGFLHAPGLRPEKSVAQLNMQALLQVFALNAFAPALLARALLPLLRHAQPNIFASLSARVGSIGDNRLGGWYSYRAAKAAQNQLLRTLAIELRRTHPDTTCILLHPGTVDTPLSKPFQAGVPTAKLFTPERAAKQLLDILVTLTPADSGRFIAWDGLDIPW